MYHVVRNWLTIEIKWLMFGTRVKPSTSPASLLPLCFQCTVEPSDVSVSGIPNKN